MTRNRGDSFAFYHTAWQDGLEAKSSEGLGDSPAVRTIFDVGWSDATNLAHGCVAGTYVLGWQWKEDERFTCKFKNRRFFECTNGSAGHKQPAAAASQLQTDPIGSLFENLIRILKLAYRTSFTHNCV